MTCTPVADFWQPEQKLKQTFLFPVPDIAPTALAPVHEGTPGLHPYIISYYVFHNTPLCLFTTCGYIHEKGCYGTV